MYFHHAIIAQNRSIPNSSPTDKSTSASIADAARVEAVRTSKFISTKLLTKGVIESLE
jgi:hypothetical protein